MTLGPSLLQAIVLMDGESLVLHVGDKPYVVAESGQVSLSNAPLTAEAIGEVIDELLSPESRSPGIRSFQTNDSASWPPVAATISGSKSVAPRTPRARVRPVLLKRRPPNR